MIIWRKEAWKESEQHFRVLSGSKQETYSDTYKKMIHSSTKATAKAHMCRAICPCRPNSKTQPLVSYWKLWMLSEDHWSIWKGGRQRQGWEHGGSPARDHNAKKGHPSVQRQLFVLTLEGFSCQKGSL